MLERLKMLREEAKISQRALADSIGVSQQSINKYENHNVEPDIETLIRMAEFFNTSVDYLVGHSDIERRIEKLSPYDLNEEEARLVARYRKLKPAQKQSIQMVIDNFDA